MSMIFVKACPKCDNDKVNTLYSREYKFCPMCGSELEVGYLTKE